MEETACSGNSNRNRSRKFLHFPIHELLHGLAYRLLGARKIIFGADLTQTDLLRHANGTPVSGDQLHILTLTPFIIINLITDYSNRLSFPGGLLFRTFFLLSHNLMCIGTFPSQVSLPHREEGVYCL